MMMTAMTAKRVRTKNGYTNECISKNFETRGNKKKCYQYNLSESLTL